jgi:ApbE superfamily uncharacterized protein (UPF0280 family)
MKPGMYEERTYRNMFKGINLVFFDACVNETDLRIGANRNLLSESLEYIGKYRRQIEAYIRRHAEFLTSLAPIEPFAGAPHIVKRMCDAAKAAGVGPMAAVAGAIGEMVGNELLRFTDEVIVENGGDIFIKTSSTRKIGIYAGKSPFSKRVALEIKPEDTPLGICTSSGTVGHSLSFGKADAVVIVSKDAFLADAAATAVCNIINSSSDIPEAIEFASSIKGVEGAVAIIGDKIGAWGSIRLTRL